MPEAFLWGALGAAALVLGALVAYELHPGRRVIAVFMALGTGLLIRTREQSGSSAKRSPRVR
jgi:zinc transporter, ZIP family